MKVLFVGPKLKIKRAYKHIDELERWFDALLQSNIDTARAHNEAHPDECPGFVMVSRPDEFYREVALIVGDAIHNLRAALDLAACSIVGSAGEDTSRMYFPMNDTRESLVGTREYRLIERTAPDFALVIANIIKPYKAGNYALWALNQLDRMDKHRLLIPTFTRSSYVVAGICEEQEDDPPVVGPSVLFAIPGVSHNGIVKNEPRAPRPGTKAYLHNQKNGYPSVEIRFGKGDIFANQPIIPTLHQFAELVREAVEALEACSSAADD